jgi:hypothetical protein
MDAIYQALLESGLTPLAPAFGASVVWMRGPLVKGALEDAYAFGSTLADALEKL